MTLQPVGVAKADVTLSQFKVPDGEDGWMYNTDFVSTIKPNGCNDKIYGYMSPYWAGPDGFDDETLVGWWDLAVLQKDFEVAEELIIPRDNVKIPFGTAVVIFTSKANMAATFAGEVLGDDYGIPLNENANTFTGIVCPVKVTLHDLEPTAGENGWMYNTDFVSTIKPNGCNDKIYGYMSPYWAGPEGFDDESLVGWWDLAVLQKDFEVAEELIVPRDNVQLDEGQAIIVFTSKPNMELVVPSAIP